MKAKKYIRFVDYTLKKNCGFLEYVVDCNQMAKDLLCFQTCTSQENRVSGIKMSTCLRFKTTLGPFSLRVRSKLKKLLMP